MTLFSFRNIVSCLESWQVFEKPQQRYIYYSTVAQACWIGYALQYYNGVYLFRIEYARH